MARPVSRLKLVQDADHRARIVAIQEVYSTWAGGGLGHPEVFIWGSERDIEVGRETLRNRLANAILGRTLLNAFRLEEESMRRFLAEIRRGGPKLVLAYAQAGFEVAAFAAAEGIDVEPQRGFIATAGMLYDHMRAQIEQTFGCRVFNRYGSREIGDMAGECEHGTGSARPAVVLLPRGARRRRPAGGARSRGRHRRDRAHQPGHAADPLPHRRSGGSRRRRALSRAAVPGPRLARVTGRTVDTFVSDTGAHVAGGYFVQLLAYRSWVGPFQILQTAPGEVEYLVVARGAVPPGDREEIVRGTRAGAGRRLPGLVPPGRRDPPRPVRANGTTRGGCSTLPCRRSGLDPAK